MPGDATRTQGAAFAGRPRQPKGCVAGGHAGSRKRDPGWARCTGRADAGMVNGVRPCRNGGSEADGRTEQQPVAGWAASPQTEGRHRKQPGNAASVAYPLGRRPMGLLAKRNARGRKQVGCQRRVTAPARLRSAEPVGSRTYRHDPPQPGLGNTRSGLPQPIGPWMGMATRVAGWCCVARRKRALQRPA